MGFSIKNVNDYLGPVGGIAGGALGGTQGAVMGMSMGNIFSQANAARETNQMNRELAERQMEFQAKMSNTAHVREVRDLKKAGLNPILSMGGSGASTPSGASATMQNPMEGIAATALEMTSQIAAMKKQNAEIDLMSEQKKNVQADTNKKDVETQVMRKGIPESEMKQTIWNKVKDIFKSGADRYKGTYKGRPGEDNTTPWHDELLRRERRERNLNPNKNRRK